jgi:predicted O-methyltransferase YrrM
MANDYLNQINKKETNKTLVSLRSFALENNVPIITLEGINFLNQIIKINNAKKILEIGTAIGYSSINMALNSNANIVSIERDEKMYKLAQKNIKEINLQSQISVILEDALETNELQLGKFDLIFIDAAKAQSINFFNKYKSILSDKGIIITDNLLFHGLINREVKSRDLKQLLRKIDNFNKFVVEQDDFDTYIYEIGDGMSLSIKKV